MKMSCGNSMVTSDLFTSADCSTNSADDQQTLPSIPENMCSQGNTKAYKATCTAPQPTSGSSGSSGAGDPNAPSGSSGDPNALAQYAIVYVDRKDRGRLHVAVEKDSSTQRRAICRRPASVRSHASFELFFHYASLSHIVYTTYILFLFSSFALLC